MATTVGAFWFVLALAGLFGYKFSAHYDAKPTVVIPVTVWKGQQWRDRDGRTVIVNDFDDQEVYWLYCDEFSQQRHYQSSPKTEFLPGVRFTEVFGGGESTK